MSNAGYARNPIKSVLHHNWDSPRNTHFDLSKLMLAQGNSMYLELVPARDSPNAQRPSPLLSQIFLFFVTAMNE